jgi:hypothetical protein
MVGDHPLGDVATGGGRAGCARDQQTGRRMEVDPVRRFELGVAAGPGELARRLAVGAGERAREGGERAVVDGGELWIGSMWRARKALDLQRDPRFAIHSGSDDPPEWSGDAKLAGVAEEIADRERVSEINGEAANGGVSHLFRLDLREVSTVGLTDDRKALVIEVWTPDAGVRRIERA